ncbi:MAG: alpha/beta hydrolase [Pseudomonadota bacterium]|jgi:enterochelin esterase-like enzyme
MRSHIPGKAIARALRGGALLGATLVLSSFAALAQPAWVTPAVQAPQVERRLLDSAAVGGPVSYHVYLPDAYAADPQRRFPVVYWLHGCGQSPTAGIGTMSAAFDGAIERGLLPPLIVVFPNGLPCGMYTDAVGGAQPVESMIIADLVPEVDRTLRTVPDRSGRIIEGFSMGGYGAARLGFKYRNLFGAVSILGGGPLQADFLTNDPGLQPLEMRRALLAQVWGGDPAAFLADSPRTLAAAAVGDLPTRFPLRQLIGAEDSILPANREFHGLLVALGIAHDYRELPGVDHAMPAVLAAMGDEFWRFHAGFLLGPGAEPVPTQGRMALALLAALVALAGTIALVARR